MGALHYPVITYLDLETTVTYVSHNQVRFMQQRIHCRVFVFGLATRIRIDVDPSQLDISSAHPHTLLVSDKHLPV